MVMVIAERVRRVGNLISICLFILSGSGGGKLSNITHIRYSVLCKGKP